VHDVGEDRRAPHLRPRPLSTKGITRTNQPRIHPNEQKAPLASYGWLGVVAALSRV